MRKDIFKSKKKISEIFPLYQETTGGLEMTQWLRILAAFSEDLSSDPSTHVRQLTTACNSSPRGSENLKPSSDFPGLPHTRKAHIERQTYSLSFLSHVRILASSFYICALN